MSNHPEWKYFLFSINVNYSNNAIINFHHKELLFADLFMPLIADINLFVAEGHSSFSLLLHFMVLFLNNLELNIFVVSVLIYQGGLF